MDKKTKILIGAIVSLTVFMVIATYYRIFTKKDYLIRMEVDCDRTIDDCLARESEEGEEPTYYKIVEQKASTLE